MTDKEMWKAYTGMNDVGDAEYEAWAFGDDADQLADLVKRGIKTGTASAYPLYAVDDEPLPKVGEYSVILDSRDEAVCIIRDTKVYVIPFNKVSEEHAYKEGEGDRSLFYWRKVHQELFTQWMAEAGLEFTEDMKVVCEEFELVYKP